MFFPPFLPDCFTFDVQIRLSKALGAENNTAPLTVLVGKNFDQIVNDDDKDVFVKFYAPWCGHCKTLAPKYDELAEHYKDDSNVVIAKIDSTENDSNTPFEVTGFPTLYFFPKGAKANPIRFNGDRTFEAMQEFIDKNRQSSPALKKASREEL